MVGHGRPWSTRVDHGRLLPRVAESSVLWPDGARAVCAKLSQEHPEMTQEHLELSRSIPKYSEASRSIQEHPEVSKSLPTNPEKATLTNSNQKMVRSIRKKHFYKKRTVTGAFQPSLILSIPLKARIATSSLKKIRVLVRPKILIT